MKKDREKEEYKMAEMTMKIQSLESESDQVKVENEKLKIKTVQLQKNNNALVDQLEEMFDTKHHIAKTIARLQKKMKKKKH